MVLHEDDDKLDFRPHKLRLGTSSQNSRDAYNNGKQSERVKCASYIDGVLEKEHLSQSDALRKHLLVIYARLLSIFQTERSL